MGYIRKIQKYHNSLIVTLPKPLTNHLKLRAGDHLSFTLTKRGIILITKINFKLSPELDNLTDDSLPIIKYE